MSQKKNPQTVDGVNRRDFLSGVSAFSLMALGIPKSALSTASSGEAAPDGKIARYGIFPAVGIARVGNSCEWYLGPEVPGLPPLSTHDSYKDADQMIKRQAARFRIYGFTEDGRVVREVTASEAKIEWSVRVGNTKASWYGFSNPLDNGEAAPGLPGRRRNAHIHGSDDRHRMLVLDSGDVSIRGRHTNASGGESNYELTGRFWNRVKVYLGELRTDGEGRLVFLGGKGKAEPVVPVRSIDNFTDNDAWYDDWSDGWVKAKVTLPDGTTHSVDPAWVMSVGPDYAPEITPIVSLHDTMVDMAVRAGWLSLSEQPSFRADIYPLFRRLGLSAWVSSAAFLRSAWLDVGDFLDPDYIRRLRDPSPENRDFRRSVLEHFRKPDFAPGEDPCPDITGDEPCRLSGMTPDQCKMPYMLGDGVDYSDSPKRFLAITQSQYRILCKWAEGNFVDDFDDPALDEGKALDEMPLACRPEALTRAGLDTCSGAAFHPGVELSWSLRHKEVFVAPRRGECFEYRVAHGTRPTLIQDVGRLLTPEKAFRDGPDGPPIGPSMPGDHTRWMGLPWQPDAYSCQSVQFGNDFPIVVWWPALLPVDILPEVYYERVMDTSLPREERLRFFNSRVSWSRGAAGIGYHVSASREDGLKRLVALWDRMGIVRKREGPKDLPEVPNEIYVETGRGSMDLDI